MWCWCCVKPYGWIPKHSNHLTMPAFWTCTVEGPGAMREDTLKVFRGQNIVGMLCAHTIVNLVF